MAKDPYRYYRVEARELIEGLTQGVLELESGGGGGETVSRLLRLAHTLKGASRVVKQAAIAEQAHALEALLADHRTGPLPRGQSTALLGIIDEIGANLGRLGGPSEASPAQPSAEEPLTTVRVEIEDLDALFQSVAEAGVRLGAIRRNLGAIDELGALTKAIDRPSSRGPQNGATRDLLRPRSLGDELRTGLEHFRRDLVVALENAEGELGEVQELAHRLRLVPAQTVFPALERAARDAAQSLGRSVDFSAAGGDVRLDASVLAAMRDALVQVVRNAIAHGVESEEERVAAGKAPQGRVRLRVERRGSRVAFSCEDDGRGVDVEGVRRAAVARGVLAAAQAQALSSAEVIRLLLAGGLSTKREVTEIAGRGIGLDVVRATALRLKGEVDIRTAAGRGTTVELRVPVSIASITGLLVEAAGAVAAIPLDAIRRTLRVDDEEVARSPDGDSLLHDGTGVPLLSLESALRPSAAERGDRAWTAVIVEAGGRAAAVGIDRIVGPASIVVRPLPSFVDPNPILAGVSFDAAGNPQMVLDPAGLIAAAERHRDVRRADEATPAKPILVVDDSLTTRMLEKSILESAGYEVELAVSAEEAMTKSRSSSYSLFIVDVEMPGMDGFEFVARTRSDAMLRQIPAILVTSRNATEDRQRGYDVGAGAYIVKSEFDQGHLLETIRTLIR